MNDIRDFKLNSIEEEAEFKYGNKFEYRVYSEWSVVVAAPDENQIPFILDLVIYWNGPFGILYVLVASRLGNQAGRYQSVEPRDFNELELFLYMHQEYFERDGRHHLWVMDLESNNRIVYDNHDLIHIYADDLKVIELCEKTGLSASEITIPSPHGHNYNPKYDKEEDLLFSDYDWKHFPLVEEHDDP